jgi:hypothetical protein
MDFINGIGRLAFDRYDFQNHLTGADPSLRHSGQSIELNPSITIDGYVATNVYSAITKLKQKVETVTPNATTSSLGLIQLNGDIGGTATNVSVLRLQGRPINNLAPSVGQALTWSGSYWEPQNIAVTFAGDLSGTALTQKVLNISGSFGNYYFNGATYTGYVSNVTAQTVLFNQNVTRPIIEQDKSNSLLVANNLSIAAQSSDFANSTGGNLDLYSGTGATLDGNICLKSSGYNLVQAGPIGTNSNQVLSLCGKDQVTTSNVYGGHLGNYTIFVKDCLAEPTGQPVGGFSLYSNGGKPMIRNEQNKVFEVGTLNNPSSWAINQTNIEYEPITNLNHIVEYSNSYAGVMAGIQPLMSFNIPSNMVLTLDLTVTGSNLYGTPDHECMVWKTVRAFKNYSGTVIELKSNTVNTFLEPGGIANSTVILTNPLNASWEVPTIQIQMYAYRMYVKVYTGKDNSGNQTNWTAVCRATYLNIA